MPVLLDGLRFDTGCLVPVLVDFERSGAGTPLVKEIEGDYRHDSRKNILEWRLPVIDASNKTGAMEFSISGHSNDFFPINVTFVSKKSFCDIAVCSTRTFYVELNGMNQLISDSYHMKLRGQDQMVYCQALAVA